MTPEPQPTDPKWGTPSSLSRRLTLTFAVIGVLAVLSSFTVVLKTVGLTKWSIFDLLSDSDEAPIRVRNGSIDLYLLSQTQEWKQDGSSGNYRIPGTHRYKEEFDVTVTTRSGAVCPALVGTGPDVIVTFSNDRSVRLQSAGRHTLVKPENGATLTWNASEPDKLTYLADGFIKSIAVGSGSNPTVMCSFTAANQLDRLTILNVP
ncbi:MAG TPA: hypothetical protein VFK57_12880 [Vicinamibacterales bacterium]|nr:hypothetical protein [Vicinamibacterales bacterium]